MATFADNSDRTFQSGDKLVGYSGGQDFSFPFTTLLTQYTSDDIAEGATNLFLTNERVDDRVNALLTTGTGISKSYDDGANTLTLSVTDAAVEAQNIRLHAVSQGTIDNTAILALNATPQAICDAPGADGLAAGMTLALKFENPATTAYTNSGINVIESTTGVILAVIPSGFLNSAANQYIFVNFTSSPSASWDANAQIQLQAISADPTGGDPTNSIKYHLAYRIVDFGGIS